MFGYFTACRDRLSEDQLRRYRGCYCGLCRTLARRHGFLGRMTLNYDMTFLVLLESSLYEPPEQQGAGRCPVRPLKKEPWWKNEFTDYAADMNLLLAWWKLLDDWEDERKIGRLLLHKLLSRRCRRLEAQYPRQSRAIREGLLGVRRYEAGAEVSPDLAARAFGGIMEALFVVREEDHWAPRLAALGFYLGVFLYLMDACIDLEEDRRKGRPNPLLALCPGPRDRAGDMALLTAALGRASSVFEELPLEQDLGLLRNILYAGVWQGYNRAFRDRDQAQEETKEENTHEGPL